MTCNKRWRSEVRGREVRKDHCIQRMLSSLIQGAEFSMPKTIEERLAKLEERQEALVAAISELGEIMIQTRSMVAELAAWLQQPPSSDLPEFLTRMAGAVEANTDSVRTTADTIVALGRILNTLPAELEKVVRG